MLLLIAAVAAVLFTWDLDRSDYHVYYATAVRSMTQSPLAFLFGSYDPANSITLDKLPGFLWPQVISAWLFGFHPWALVLPQAVEGVLCVLLLYKVARRWAGVVPALLAATVLTLTPVTVGLGRSIVEDSLFTLLLLLAAEAVQRAVEHARLRILLLAAAYVGLAFQTKMLEAWAVLPALGLTYLVAAPVSLRRRVGHVALAGVVTVALSASWIVIAALIPASDRPYIDGTTNNSALSMVVGYNFLSRFGSLGFNATATGSVIADQQRADPPELNRPAETGTASRATPTVSASSSPHTGDTVAKMASPGIASQTGWLYPLGMLAIGLGVLGLIRRRAARTDPHLAHLLLWGVWLATYFLVFSLGSVTGHTYYMGVVAVPLAALSGTGITLCWRAYKAGGTRAWVLPAALAVNAAWCALLALCYPRFLPWLAPMTIGLCAVALALLCVPRPGRTAPHPATMVIGIVTGVASLLVAPGAWSVSALDARYSETGGMGRVGPTSHQGRPQGLTPQQRRLLAYVTAHRAGARYLFAVERWTDASPYILYSGVSILPMGGYTGQVPFPTLSQFSGLVASGQVHYVLSRFGRGAGGWPGSTTAQVTSWIHSSCTLVRDSAYGGPLFPTTRAGAAGGPHTAASPRWELRRCGPAV
ncbi:glycosyltransferase family 39 protein [Sphaerisporangium perillae]|uniref:glycosyltransferase family 39 protein n=1 Tax=Sphaerisporangium perillae TaxID=2935860 RepID=UPI00200C2746|nr:glycosyltransferase family 39 protein [Sphaerisporangium perillae]